MKTALPILVTSVTFAIVGCNAILANDPGILVITDEAGTEPLPVQPAPPPQDEDSGVPPPPPVTPDAGTACPAGQRVCGGVCVSAADPLYGCGSPTCAPCATAHGTAACQGGTCVVASCTKGYADCNAKPADGCEVNLAKATSCGACNAVCSTAAPICAPSGATFECTTGCSAAAPALCGNECVDTTSNPNHCGGCGVPCPAVANATIACTASACTFTCIGLRRACNGECVTRTDPTACGDACVVCPVPAGSRATCTNDTCGSVCTVNFGDCNMDPADGCEAKLTEDPANCGACGKVCPAGNVCKNRMCKPGPGPAPP